jgi:hypothetical protein
MAISKNSREAMRSVEQLRTSVSETEGRACPQR